MGKKAKKAESELERLTAGRPSAVVDTRVVYCGDNLEQLKRLPEGCVDLIYIDPPFNSNRNYEVFWGETKEKRADAFFVPLGPRLRGDDNFRIVKRDKKYE